MKLNARRLILIAGLTLALNLNGSLSASAAGATKSQSIRLAQAPMNPNFQQISGPPVPALDWKPTPISPPPASSSVPPLYPTPDPQSQTGSSGVTTAPMPLGTQPNLSPAPRAPLGFHYGEQDRLDARTNPPPRPLPTVPYPGPPSAQLAPGAIGVPLYPVPDREANPGSPVDPNIPAASPGVATDRFGYAPPPGTLGQTYKRRSRPLEDNKHPRVGVVEVRLPEGVDVTAAGLKSKWTGKVWRLESDALLPGIPHIYEVKASWGTGTEPQVRTIRLIIGRIVDLDF